MGQHQMAEVLGAPKTDTKAQVINMLQQVRQTLQIRGNTQFRYEK